jgi:hypothetical protein
VRDYADDFRHPPSGGGCLPVLGFIAVMMLLAVLARACGG